MINALTLHRSHLESMIGYVDAQLPLEACGLLGGCDGQVDIVITVKNAAGSPIRYRMEPREQLAAFEQIESTGREILAIFHSHPTGPAVPSPSDIAEASFEVVYIILSPLVDDWQARAFWIEDGHAAEIPLVVTGV